MITDNTAKWRVGSISTPQVSSGDGLLPVGHIYYTMGSSVPAGSLPLKGQVFSRSTYKDLWEWVNLHPEQLLSESAWQTKYIENNGLVPFYSEGTDSTNFRVPNCTTLGLQNMDYVVDEWQQGMDWYRVWKSGWIEQGGGFSTVSSSYVSHTVNLHKYYKNNLYSVNLITDYTTYLDGAPTVESKTAKSMRVHGIHNTGGNASWNTEGYGEKPIVDEKVLWCVKAFGNIDESVGSTSLTNIANNITQLNTKVDNWVSGTLDSHATAIAKMQSYFNGSYEKTLLAGGGAGITSGNVVLSDSWRNYDGLMIFMCNDAHTGVFAPHIIWKAELEFQLEVASSATGMTRFTLAPSSNGEYWYYKLTSTDINLITDARNSDIVAIYGIKLKATGITNKSALDVSQISDKISSLLTTDNHLRLPSGLEVW